MRQFMRALLICPEWPDTYWSFKHALPFEGKRSAYPPLGLLTVASMLPTHWEKRLIDMNVRRLKDSDLQWANVVMIGAMLVQCEGALEVLRRCKQLGIETVVGGPIAGTVPAIREAADHVVIGEAEELMEALCKGLEEGNAEREYHAVNLPELSKTPLPDLSLINPKHYSAMAIQFSRGCPFNCEFCDIIEMFGRKPRTKPIPQVLAELEQLRSMGWRSSVFLVDDNFIGNKKNVKLLLPALAEWNEQHNNVFSFFTEASVNLADDEELLEMMQRAGFFRVFLGIETPEEESLKAAQKYQNTKRSLLDAVKQLQRYGMEVMAGFIVGFDTDTEDVFDKQVEFIKESAIPLAMVGLLQALPGTQLYRRLVKEGRLLASGNGNNIDLKLNFLPKMDPARLVEGYRSILRRIYDTDAYYDRVRTFLARYHPVHHERKKRWSDYQAFFLSMLKQGILDEGRGAYWKFLFDAATRYRHNFSTAITLAVMGYHLRVITRQVLEADVSGPEPCVAGAE
jgi:radical SAM superfamily enzyme YgiQ (UPF0313 family)